MEILNPPLNTSEMFLKWSVHLLQILIWTSDTDILDYEMMQTISLTSPISINLISHWLSTDLYPFDTKIHLISTIILLLFSHTDFLGVQLHPVQQQETWLPLTGFTRLVSTTSVWKFLCANPGHGDSKCTKNAHRMGLGGEKEKNRKE